MIIHGDIKSGNCLKVKWTADALGIPYIWVPVDIMKGENRTAVYLAKFPQGQVPGIELDDGSTLAQSNAIIRYFARGTRLLPDDPFTQAKVDEWLFWEQYSHEPYVATCRFHMVYLGKSKETRDPAKVERGEKALDYMEAQLKARSHLANQVAPPPQGGKESSGFLVGDKFTIADIALYAYTHVAHEGGFNLASRPNLQAWLGAVSKTLSNGAA
jgi:glutathione S-transferase